MNDLDQLVARALDEFAAAPTPAELENAKARFIGKSGGVTEMLKALASLSPQEKKARGAQINLAKQRIESALQARRQALADAELVSQLKAEALDVTLPGRQHGQGGLHPVSRTMERIEAIFASMGFDVADGPEIETDWMSFTALNNPENHPARSMQDTFYVDIKDEAGRWLNLRPHTSPMQVRYARAHAARHAGAHPMPDIRVIAPGRTYRVDSDATHSPMFHQCEGLWIGENVSFKDLKVVFTEFLPAVLRERGPAVAVSAIVLSVHRAFGRDRHRVRERSAEGPVARSGGLGSGAPECGAEFRTRSGALHRLRIRHGARSTGDAALRRRRPATVLRRGSTVPVAVQLNEHRAAMQFPESWLREFCDPPLSSQALADLLTMSGLEVESMRSVAPPFSGVVVAQIIEVEQHPNAERLRVCRVDAGPHSKDGPLQIVCGAPNARVGLRVPLALVGAQLPPGEDGKPFEIRKGVLRGVESTGMLCSARELRLSDDHGGLLELDGDASIGADLRQALRLDDTLFTLKLTPNLAHCLSVYGIAREVSALTGAPLHTPTIRADRADPRRAVAGDDRGHRPVRPLLGSCGARRQHPCEARPAGWSIAWRDAASAR